MTQRTREIVSALFMLALVALVMFVSISKFYYQG